MVERARRDAAAAAAAAHRRRGRRRRARRARRVVAGVAAAWSRRDVAAATARRRRRRPPPRRRSRSGSSSRRASRATQMAARVTAVAQDRAAASAARAPRLAEPRTSRRRGNARRPPASARSARPLEGFLFPATYDFPRETTSRSSSSRRSSRRSAQNWAKVNLRYARSKNLTPYDVLIIASMIEKEAPAPERAAARRRGDLQPAARADAARHRRDDSATGCDIPPTEVAHAVAARSDPTRTTRAAASRACRRRRSRTPGSPRCRRPRTRRRSTTSTSCASRTRRTTSSRRAATAFEQYHADARLLSAVTRLVALLGHPVAHSLSPRMQNAAFAARGLDWAYVALDVEPERLDEAVRGLAALGSRART